MEDLVKDQSGLVLTIVRRGAERRRYRRVADPDQIIRHYTRIFALLMLHCTRNGFRAGERQRDIDYGLIWSSDRVI